MSSVEVVVGSGCIIAAVGLVAIGVIAAVVEENNWNQFSAQHECRNIGSISPSTSVGVGVGSNGGVSVVPVYTPGKTGYQCNDGKQYWR